MITRIYDTLLRLYPRTFRAEFAAEMRETFALILADHPPGKRRLRFCLNEFVGLAIGCGREHWVAYCSLSMRQRQWHQARWILCVANLLLSFFYLFVTIDGSNTLSIRLIQTGLVSTTLFGTIRAFWDVRDGGRWLVGGAVVCGVGTGFLFGNINPFLFGISLLAGALWSLPQILFGIMLISLDRKREVIYADTH